MEKLMEIAKRIADQIEIYSGASASDGVNFENSKLKHIDSKLQYGIALRIIKDGRLGFAYTRNLVNREELVQNAFASLKGGVEAKYEFPLTKQRGFAPLNPLLRFLKMGRMRGCPSLKLPQVKSYDGSIEKLTNTQMVEECTRTCKTLGAKTKGEIHVGVGRETNKIRIMNSSGTDVSAEFSEYSGYAGILYPGSHSSIGRIVYNKKFEKFPDRLINFMLDAYNRSLKEAKPKGGRMKVLFMPEALYALIWRLKEGTNGKNIYEKVSPIKDKFGQKIMSEKLTIVDEPLCDSVPNARVFDDEGTACQNLTIIEAGVLKNYYTDLNYAQKLNVKSSGNGYKVGISSKVIPLLAYLTVKPGKKSLAELIKAMEKGVIVCGVMGAHSGNILNGDFSVGLAPGIYVENGEIVGRVKDAMVAGNIYETMKNVIDVEDTVYPGYTAMFPPSLGMLPAVLFDDVSVVTKN
jgi:PmbA protein